jgi:hypothetical protein
MVAARKDEADDRLVCLAAIGFLDQSPITLKSVILAYNFSGTAVGEPSCVYFRALRLISSVRLVIHQALPFHLT